MNYKEFVYNENEQLLQSFGVKNFANNNVTHICVFGKIENIKLLEGEDFTNYNIKEICIFGKPENIKLLKGKDFTNDNVKYMCENGRPELIKKYIKKYLK